jgi:predicted flavoprotein YhiN
VPSLKFATPTPPKDIRRTVISLGGVEFNQLSFKTIMLKALNGFYHNYFAMMETFV